MLQWFLNNPSGILVEILIGILAIRWFRVPADRRKTEFIFLGAVSACPVALFIQNFLEFLGRAVPVKYDFYVDRFDAEFGQPSFVVGQFFAAHHLALWGTFIYNLPFIITVAVVALYLWSGRSPVVVIRVSVLLWVLLVPLYLVFPVSGPKYAFASFPYLHASYLPHAAIIPGAPNGVPSGHMAFALITLYLVRHWKWLIVPGALFALATALTALGTGEHYLLDLVLAVPFAALLVWISESPHTAHGMAQQPAKTAWSGSLAAWENTEPEAK
jgi:hypothetical protein